MDGARWNLRWYEVAPEAVLAAGLTFFLVDEPDAATSAFRSGKAVGLMVAVSAAWLVARLAAARFVRPPVARLALFALPAAAALAIVVLPAYDDETVVETPVAVGAGSRGEGGAAPAPAAAGGDAGAPAERVRLRQGALRGIDHRASGTAVVYRDGDGGYVVGLEEFDIQPGPDYDLYVVPGADRDRLGGATRLDDLRGNRGTQFYDVPAGLDLGSGDWTVLVWCQTFAVPIANATPLAA